MKKALMLLFPLVLVCMLTTCIIIPDDKVINGTVTITRNGIPWNADNFPSSGNASAVFSRDAHGPPQGCPQIFAYTTPNNDGWRGDYVGVAYADGNQNPADGTYRWTMKIAPEYLPNKLYFRVESRMENITMYFKWHHRYKMTKGILVDDKTFNIDLGVIDYKTLQLSGNLPVSINGEPLSKSVKMSVFHTYPRPPNTIIQGGSAVTKIAPNGDWSVNIFAPDSPQPLTFQVETHKNNGIFWKTLNGEDVFLVHDSDLEIIFPSYPSLDFKAFNISGTIKAVAPGTGEYRFYTIRFFREEGAEFIDSSSSGSYLLSEISTGWDESGLFEWNTMIPALELPHELLYSYSLYKSGKNYDGHSSVILTADTDLSNIDLGVITFN